MPLRIGCVRRVRRCESSQINDLRQSAELMPSWGERCVNLTKGAPQPLNETCGASTIPTSHFAAADNADAVFNELARSALANELVVDPVGVMPSPGRREALLYDM